MNFAILRLKKCHMEDLNGIHRHNMRVGAPKNVNPSGNFKRIIGDPNKTTKELVSEHIIGEEVTGLRKNSVVAGEILLTASPGFFRSGEEHKFGCYDKKQTKMFIESSVKFLRDNFGDHLVEVTAHLDEATPHLHCIFVPVLTKKIKQRRTIKEIKDGVPPKGLTLKRLAFNEMFTDDAYSKLQDEYAQSMEHLGLHRGIKGSKAGHEKMSDFYRLINSANYLNMEVEKLELDLPDFVMGEDIVEYANRLKTSYEISVGKYVKSLNKGFSELSAAALQLTQELRRERLKVHALIEGLDEPPKEAYRYLALQETQEALIKELEEDVQELNTQLDSVSKLYRELRDRPEQAFKPDNSPINRPKR